MENNVRDDRYEETFLHKAWLKVAWSQINNPGKLLGVYGLGQWQSWHETLVETVPWRWGAGRGAAPQCSTMMPRVGGFQPATEHTKKAESTGSKVFFCHTKKQYRWMVYVYVLFTPYLHASLFIYLMNCTLKIFINKRLSTLLLNTCFSGERSLISPHLYFIFHFSFMSMLWLKHNLCSWKVGLLSLNFSLTEFSILSVLVVQVPSIISGETEASAGANSFDLSQMPPLDQDESFSHVWSLRLTSLGFDFRECQCN